MKLYPERNGAGETTAADISHADACDNIGANASFHYTSRDTNSMKGASGYHSSYDNIAIQPELEGNQANHMVN